MMRDINEQLSSLIDNENVENKLLDSLINDELQQNTFSRYQLIGDAMRNEHVTLTDVTKNVMAEIEQQVPFESVVLNEVKPTGNVIAFVKRFGQYAIAASVAGVVVMSSFLTSQPFTENKSIDVLNTTPFSGVVSPVSFQAKQGASKQTLQERHQRLEALLKDHQLQLQIQP